MNFIMNPIIKGHIKIFDPTTKEVFIDKPNAIHYENFSLALAYGVSNQGYNTIAEMSFGNGGTRVDDTGIITYLTPNVIGTGANLYNQTYVKVVDSRQPTDLDPARNYMEVRHAAGAYYSDVLVSCLLDFGEPNGQQAFDNQTNSNCLLAPGALPLNQLASTARTPSSATSLNP